MGADSVTMKEWNKNSVRSVLKQKRVATKAEISAGTGLSVVTVNALIGEMVKEGEVLMGEPVPSNGGRPSMQYLYHANYGLAVVIYGHREGEKNKIHMLVTNLYGQCIKRVEQYIEPVLVESFDIFLNQFFEEYPSICMIAFGLPGEEEDGNITINDYADIIGETFMKHYEEKYKVPIIFENDANAAVRGYYEEMGKCGHGNMACLYFPKVDAPGAGMILEGEVYHGLQNFAGEIGYIDFPYRWQEMDYQNSRQVGEMVGSLSVMYCCILAPESLVLYGEFFTEENKLAVKQYWKQRIPERMKCSLIFSQNFSRDFEKGMIGISVEKMEQRIFSSNRAAAKAAEGEEK